MILEPIEAPAADVAAWRAKLDGFLDASFPDVAEDAPLQPDDTISFE